MTPRSNRITRHAAAVAVMLGALLAPRGLPAEGSAPSAAIGLGPASQLWIQGTSNVHDFESRTSQVAVTFTRDPGAADPADAAAIQALVRGSGIRGLELKVPVATLKSEKSGLDKNLRSDLKGEQFPEIRFRMTKYTLGPNAATADTIAIQAEGTLSIAGREKPATLSGRVYRGDGGMWLDGSHKLLMTDFGIQPRKMMMGALRVRDQVTVRYHLLLVPAAAAASAAGK